LVTSVLTQLAVAGETADRFLAVMRSVEMADEKVTTIDGVSTKDLRTVLGDWTNLLVHLDKLPK